MRRIWSRCVGIITSMGGRLHIGPSSEPTSDRVLAMLQEMYPGKVILKPSPWSWLKWLVKLRGWQVIHLFGIHYPIPVEEWNSEQGSLRFIGDECWICGASM